MKKFAIEFKWAIIFTVITILWMILEKSVGLHDEYIAKHYTYSMLFAIPAILVFVVALLDKRKNFYNNKMTWLEGFLSGMVISVIVAIFSPLAQFITLEFISPEYFPNAISYAVESHKMTQQEAEDYFNLTNYMMQSAFGGLLMGVITSAVVALFVRKRIKN